MHPGADPRRCGKPRLDARPSCWAKLAELGLLGLRVPEEYGGLGMDEVDLVLLLEETGRAALARAGGRDRGGRVCRCSRA